MIQETYTASSVFSQKIPSEKIEYQTKEDHATLDEDDFMKLFVTQLQYQDPMNPMESSEMASEVAQFNMVDLLYKNNAALEDMAKAENTAASIASIGLLGRRVEYQGNEIFVDPDGPEPFYIEAPAEDAVSCKITIKDKDGRIVNRLDMDGIDAGEKKRLDWDGTDSNGDQVQEGKYKVYVEAVDSKGNEVSVKTWTTGQVMAIGNSSDGLPEISILDGPTISISDVIKIVN
jgi:flagellar basal-body rod modification protein FlgD